MVGKSVGSKESSMAVRRAMNSVEQSVD
jgi:hypothetical protein